MLPDWKYQLRIFEFIILFSAFILLLNFVNNNSDFCIAQLLNADGSKAESKLIEKLPDDRQIKSSGVTERTFKSTMTREIGIRYLLYLPWHYGDNDKLWPLLLYLHGGMGRGDDFKKMAWYPVPKLMLENDSIPFIVVAPQCPAGEMWTDADMLITLIQHICGTLAVDTNRIYLAGYSMGGAGTWELAYRYPDKFAAIAPMSGWCSRFIADRLKQVPIWIFHGKDDNIVSVQESEELIRELQKLRAEVKFSLVPGRRHSPPTIKEHKELFDWFLKHIRKNSNAIPHE